jgi:putative transposase
MKKPTPSYQRHRFPSEIISHAIWLYHRFCLSFREVEELLAERGVTVTYETVRQWCQKFGPDYARNLKKPQGAWAIRGISTKSLSPFKGSASIYGVPWIKTASVLIFSCNAVAISVRLNAFSAVFSKAKEVNLDSWSPINSEVMMRLIGRSCPR